MSILSHIALTIAVILFFPISQALAITTPPSNQIFSGTITETNGQPLAGVNVKITNGLTSTNVTTDANGNYSGGSAPNANYAAINNESGYAITPSKLGHTFTATTYSNSQKSTNGTTIRNDFTASPILNAISGTITDLNGQPMPGLKVTINDGTGFGASSVTNQNGYYDQGGLKNATYLVSPSKTGYIFSTANGSLSQTINNGNATKDFIGKNPPPTVTLTTPANAATYVSPASITVNATATDSAGGTISLVEFYAGTNLIGSANTPPYSMAWANVSTGTYHLTAKATDNEGTTGLSTPVTVRVADPLAILTTKLLNAILNISTSEGLVASGGIAPYNWSIVAGSLPTGLTLNASTGILSGKPTLEGTSSFTAQVTDAANQIAQQPYTLKVSSTALAITSPFDGAQLDRDSVLVAGTYQGMVNAGISVNGQVACTNGTAFYANNLPLIAGANTLLVNAISPSGQTASTQIAVSVLAHIPVAVTVTPACGGIAPHVATFGFSSDTGTSIQRIEADFDGNGSVDAIITDFTAPIQFTYQRPGTYLAQFAITDSTGAIYHTTEAVIVNDVADLDALLRGVYTSMLSQLKASNTDSALNYVTAGVTDKYRDVFTSLKPNLPFIVDLLGTIQSGTISGNMAEYVVVRNTPNGQQAFLMYFLYGEDGVWRIDGM